MARPLYLWGAGDVALWVIDLVDDLNRVSPSRQYEIAALIADDEPVCPALNEYCFISRKKAGWEQEVNRETEAVIAVGAPRTRRLFYDEIKKFGLGLPPLIHPSAVISRHAQIEEANLVGANCVLAFGVHLEANCLINFNCTIGHYSKLGKHSVLSSGTQIGGGVQAEEEIFTGMNAVLIPRITLGARAEISAGALLTSSVEEKVKVVAPLPRRIQT